MLYPLFQNGFTGSVEAVKFIQEVTGQEDISISQQDIGKQRGYLSPILYKDMFKDYITEFYKNFSAEFEKDGYIWVACDGSICKLPNTNITREQFEIEEDTEFERHWPRARASCIVDVNSGLILTSEFDTTKVTEVEMAKNHLQDLNNDFNLKKFVFIFDRGYGSFELIIALLKNESKFIIRLDSRTINKERQKMESDDEFVNITMNKLRTKEIKDPELKKNAEQENYLNLRITNIELTNNKGKKYTETLLSNLPIEKFTKKDLKNAYGQRWLIETDYDRLKKTFLELENFTGHRRTIIEQGHSTPNIIHVQPTNSTKTRRRQKNTRKTQKQKPKTRITQYRPKPPNGNTKLQIQPISNGQRKKQTKNNQTNTTTSTKQTSNQKRKKKKTLKTPQRRLPKQKIQTQRQKSIKNKIGRAHV